MSSVVQIPLDKNPEVADLALDLQPGDKVYACFQVKAKDDQTLSLRIEEVARTKDELPDKEDYDRDDDSEEVDEGRRGTSDEEDGDGSDDDERDEARYVAGP